MQVVMFYGVNSFSLRILADVEKRSSLASRSTVIFTGNAETDFANLNSPDVLIFPNTNPVSGSDWMNEHGLKSGWDIKSINMQYDWISDALYVGIDCWGICGDADGDGNPSVSTDCGNRENGEYAECPNTFLKDYHLQEIAEATTFSLWTETPAFYNGSTTTYAGYRPDVVIGDSFSASLTQFNSYTLNVFQNCPGKVYVNSASCNSTISTIARTPANTIDAMGAPYANKVGYLIRILILIFVRVQS